jgi:DNA polymerase-1
MIMLIDGSSILSTCFFGNIPKEYLKAKTDEEYEAILPRILQTKDGLYTNAIYGFCKILKKIDNLYKPEYMAVAWDLNRNTFRREMYPEYKAQRKPTRPELSQQFEHMQKLLNYIGIASFGVEGVEADDLIGSMAKKYGDNEIVILTKDQDQLQLISDNVTVWLNTHKSDDIVVDLGIKQTEIPKHLEGTFPFTPDYFKRYYGFEPIQMIDYKGLSGDSSDNIPGVAGVGDKSAIMLVSEFGSVENVINFVKNASDEDMNTKKAEMKAKGHSRVPFKALKEDAEGANMGLTSKVLATIKCDCEVPELEDIKYAPNVERQKKMYERLQFKSLL